MSIVIPIVFGAAVFGLFVQRPTAAHWLGMAGWILAVLGYNFFRH